MKVVILVNNIGRAYSQRKSPYNLYDAVLAEIRTTTPTSGEYQLISEILGDKTMDEKLKNIPNDNKQNYPFCRLKFLVKKFGL